jgi:predicted transcriptional regulator
MKYRSSTEIINKILESVASGATKTRIMYEAYMSYAQLKSYLDLMQNKELIEFEERNHLYRITEKGRKFVELYKEINELVPGADERNETAKP